jgi:arginine:agmatine antiporter
MLANVSVILSLMAYVLAGVSLLRLLPRLGSRGRQVAAAATALAAIGCSLALIASAKPIELLVSLIAPIAAAGLYLTLRRR